MKTGLWIFIGCFSALSALGNVGGFCSAVDVDGTNAYVGAGQILLCIDVSDSTAPVLKDSLYLSGLIEDVLVSGTNIYAACGEAGVHRISTCLEVNNSYDSPGNAYGLALDNASLYLADGVGGLKVLNPVSLAVTDSYVTNGPAMDVLVDSGSIYLLDHFNGVIALDGSLNETAVQGAIAFGTRMVSDGTLLYVADSVGNITQIDQTSLALATNAPAAIPTFALASGMAIDGNRLYAAQGFSGLGIYDLSSETLLGTFSAVARSRATAIANGLAYVAAGNSGVKIFDLSDPTQPAYLSSVACSNALDVALADGLLLVADSFDGLLVYDSATLARLGAYTPPSPAVIHRVAATGSIAYGAEGYTVHKLDLSDPASPALVESVASPNYVFDLAVAGSELLLGTGTVHSISVDGAQALADWSLLDISDPLTPVAITNFAPLVQAMQLTLAGNAVYASADDGGTIIQKLLSERLFAVAGIDAGEGGIALSWHSEPGRTYTIHKSTNLLEGFYVFKSDVAATPPLNGYVDLENQDYAMYMITVE